MSLVVSAWLFLFVRASFRKLFVSWSQRAPWESVNCTSNMIMSYYVWELISFSVLRSWLPASFFWRRNASFRPQQVWSQWTIQASMPVGEPSLSMQGSLPPLFLSVVLIPSPSLSVLLFILFSSPVKYTWSLLFYMYYLNTFSFFLDKILLFLVWS